MSKEAAAKPNKSTQSYLKISEIKEDVMTLNDGSLRAILLVASINFALKNSEEQNALIYAYQNFLNSLDFDLQILMQSRKMDIHTYLQNLKIVMQQQTNELLRIQTAEYIEFISKLVDNSSIMNKSFYVIVPYSQATIKPGTGGIMGMFGGSAKEKYAEDLKNFEDTKAKLEQRVTTVISGLTSMGLRSVQLKTPEITELMYNSYNFEAGPIIDATKLNDIKMTN